MPWQLSEDGRRRIVEAQHRRKGKPENARTQEQRFAESQRAMKRIKKEDVRLDGKQNR